MHVYFTPRARQALLRMAQRWKEKARHPEVFESDIAIVVGRLACAHTTGFRAKRTNRRVVYRMGTVKKTPRLLRLHVVDVENPLWSSAAALWATQAESEGEAFTAT